MMTLDEAYVWYYTARSQFELLGRLGKKHWGIYLGRGRSGRTRS
jgi:hypothetical protein